MPQIETLQNEVSLPAPVANYVRAVNTGTREEFAASFAADAVVVDVNRELRGLEAIAEWAGTDIFAADVRFDILEVTERQARTILTLRIDGTFDRTGLPDPLVMKQ